MHVEDNGDIQNLADAQSVILMISLAMLDFRMSFTSQYFISEQGSNLSNQSFPMFYYVW